MSHPCWAFNKQGNRCDAEGGHEGPHTLTIEWYDDDVWTPDLASGIPQMGIADGHLGAVEEENLGPVPSYGPDADNGRCMICNHAMHVMECERCDCKAGI